jgi:ribosome modulation factor
VRFRIHGLKCYGPLKTDGVSGVSMDVCPFITLESGSSSGDMMGFELSKSDTLDIRIYFHRDDDQ